MESSRISKRTRSAIVPIRPRDNGLKLDRSAQTLPERPLGSYASSLCTVPSTKLFVARSRLRIKRAPTERSPWPSIWASRHKVKQESNGRRCKYKPLKRLPERSRRLYRWGTLADSLQNGRGRCIHDSHRNGRRNLSVVRRDSLADFSCVTGHEDRRGGFETGRSACRGGGVRRVFGESG